MVVTRLVGCLFFCTDLIRIQGCIRQCCRVRAGKKLPLDDVTVIFVLLDASLGGMENGEGEGGSGSGQTWT